MTLKETIKEFTADTEPWWMVLAVDCEGTAVGHVAKTYYFADALLIAARSSLFLPGTMFIVVEL